MPKEEVNQHGGLRKEEDEELEIDLDDSKFAEKHSESATCVIQRLQKASNTTQRHQIFYSRCSVKSKISISSLTERVVRISFLEHWTV